MLRGDARTLEFFLVVPATREADHDSDVATYAGMLGQIGMGLRRLEEPELSLRLACVTRPDVPSHWYVSLGSTSADDAHPSVPLPTGQVPTDVPEDLNWGAGAWRGALR